MLDLESAIKHCEEKAKELREQVDAHMVVDAEDIGDCIECAEEHEQLADWLKELKRYRETDCLRQRYEKYTDMRKGE